MKTTERVKLYDNKRNKLKYRKQRKEKILYQRAYRARKRQERIDSGESVLLYNTENSRFDVDNLPRTIRK